MTNRNVYMGPKSTARIPVNGIVDNSTEILMGMVATGYDSVNSIMLTRQPGVFDPTTKQEIAGRFNALRMIASKRAPSKIPIINKIEKLSLANYDGRLSDRAYLSQLRDICRRNGLSDDLISMAQHKVDMAEVQHKQPVNPVAAMFKPLKKKKQSMQRPRMIKKEKHPLAVMFNQTQDMKQPVLQDLAKQGKHNSNKPINIMHPLGWKDKRRHR